MDSFILFWFFVILVVVLIAVGLVYLAYRIPKRLGKRRLGIFLATVLSLVILSPILSFVLEDYLFFKTDAIELLAEHEIKLEDDFEIESNKMSGIGDYSHRFELIISSKDKEQLINAFLHSENYKVDIPEPFDIRSNKPRYSNSDKTYSITYQDDTDYIYEYYKPNPRGNKPIWDRISISKKNNILSYIRILD